MGQEKYQDQNPVVSLVIRRFFERIGHTVAGFEPRTVLDAGCGEGEILHRGVLGPGITTVCLDRSMGSLREVRSRAVPKELVCASVDALPFADRSFDVAVCLEVLEHLDEPAAAIRELSRVARKAIVVSVPHEPYFRLGNVLRGKHVSRFGNHPEHVQHWNFTTFRSFLSSSLSEIQLFEAFPWIIASCRPGPR